MSSITQILNIGTGMGVTEIVTNSGTANPSGGIINIVGGTGITTSASGNTVTITSTVSSGSLVFIQSKTAASATSLAFTTGISTIYDDYLLIYKKGTIEAAASDTQSLVVQISSNGGSSYVSTGYINSKDGAFLTATAGFALASTISTLGTANFSGAMTFTNLTAASDVPTSQGVVSQYNSTTGDFFSATFGGIYTPGSVIINAFQIVMDDGSAFSGTFNLYGYVQ